MTEEVISHLAELDGLTLHLEKGDTQKLDGGTVPIQWFSSDKKVVTVDSYGVVTAVGSGNALIGAISGEEQASISVIVAESEYSEWMLALPSGITEANYEIETGEFYRFREKELTTSTESQLPGWTLYSSDTTAGNYGEWSSWQTAPVQASQTREVQSVVQYSFRTITTPVEYGEWSDWGYWTTDRREKNSTTDESSRKTYRYFYYTCPVCGIRSPVAKCYEQNCGAAIGEDALVEIWTEISYAKASHYEWSSRTRYSGTERFYRTIVDGSSYFFEDVESDKSVRTEYRYRTRSYTPAKWSNWSEWQTEKPAASSSTEVQERTLYRYRDMATQKLNYFERWAAWSEPIQYVTGQTALINTDTVEYKRLTMFRYREK